MPDQPRSVDEWATYLSKICDTEAHHSWAFQRSDCPDCIRHALLAVETAAYKEGRAVNPGFSVEEWRGVLNQHDKDMKAAEERGRIWIGQRAKLKADYWKTEERHEFYRFWMKVKVTETCWEWTATIVKDTGYGHFWLHDKNVRAHRASWEFFIGGIPEEVCVLHHCDNPKCVRPDHLFLGTIEDNNRDRDNKGRAADTRGSKNAISKLTEGDIPDIRRRAAAGESHYAIARDYGVTDATIYAIAVGRAWKHVPDMLEKP